MRCTALALVAFTLTLCAAHVASAQHPQTLARADRLRIQQAIAAGDDALARRLLAKALPGGDGCTVELLDTPDVQTQARYYADVGVLARRSRDYALLGRCLYEAMVRGRSNLQAAALFEVALLVDRLDEKQRRVIHDALLERHGRRGRLYKGCLPGDLGPLRLLDCALIGLDPSGGPLEADPKTTLLTEAASWVPKPAYVRRLDRERALRTGALSPPLVEKVGQAHPDQDAAVKAAVARMTEPGAQPEVELRTSPARGPWQLLDVSVYSRDDQGPTGGKDRSALLVWTPPGGGAVRVFEETHLAVDLQPDEVELGAWDPAHGTLTMHKRGEYGDATPGFLSWHTRLLCQVDGGAPRCIETSRTSTTYDASDSGPDIVLTRGGNPQWRWQAGRLVAHAEPGVYVHPQLAVFEGKTLAEALDALPAVHRALLVDLGHPPPPEQGAPAK